MPSGTPPQRPRPSPENLRKRSLLQSQSIVPKPNRVGPAVPKGRDRKVSLRRANAPRPENPGKRVLNGNSGPALRAQGYFFTHLPLTWILAIRRFLMACFPATTSKANATQPTRRTRRIMRLGFPDPSACKTTLLSTRATHHARSRCRGRDDDPGDFSRCHCCGP